MARRRPCLRGSRSVPAAVFLSAANAYRGPFVGLTVSASIPAAVLLESILGGVMVALLMLAAAFLFSAVAAYMAGLVGSSNNPVSGVTIATIMSSSAPNRPGRPAPSSWGPCCAAAIGGDNMQDLKAGAILGASPAAQQLAQMLGVIAAVCVISPVLSLLLHAYGIGVSEAAHRNALPAPQASLMVAVVRGGFGGDLPWAWVMGGGVIALDIDGQPAAWPGLVLMLMLMLSLGLWLWQLARSAPTRSRHDRHGGGGSDRARWLLCRAQPSGP